VVSKKLLPNRENPNKLFKFVTKFLTRKSYFVLKYKLKLIFLSGTCLLILLKYMENLEYSGQKKLRKSILACSRNIWHQIFRIMKMKSPLSLILWTQDNVSYHNFRKIACSIASAFSWRFNFHSIKASNKISWDFCRSFQSAPKITSIQLKMKNW
jgi:hypothetical protein